MGTSWQMSSWPATESAPLIARQVQNAQTVFASFSTEPMQREPVPQSASKTRIAPMERPAFLIRILLSVESVSLDTHAIPISQKSVLGHPPLASKWLDKRGGPVSLPVL